VSQGVRRSGRDTRGRCAVDQAFRVLAADAPKRDAERQVRVIREVATAAGTVEALIGGQMADIESEGEKVDGSALEYIHRSKTGAMIAASVVVGGIVAGANGDQIEKLRAYGECIGLAFQIADDILDVTSTSEQLGKTPARTRRPTKATYPAIHGIAASQHEHASLSRGSRDRLEPRSKDSVSKRSPDSSLQEAREAAIL